MIATTKSISFFDHSSLIKKAKQWSADKKLAKDLYLAFQILQKVKLKNLLTFDPILEEDFKFELPAWLNSESDCSQWFEHYFLEKISAVLNGLYMSVQQDILQIENAQGERRYRKLHLKNGSKRILKIQLEVASEIQNIASKRRSSGDASHSWSSFSEKGNSIREEIERIKLSLDKNSKVETERGDIFKNDQKSSFQKDKWYGKKWLERKYDENKIHLENWWVKKALQSEVTIQEKSAQYVNQLRRQQFHYENSIYPMRDMNTRFCESLELLEIPIELTHIFTLILDDEELNKNSFVLCIKEIFFHFDRTYRHFFGANNGIYNTDIASCTHKIERLFPVITSALQTNELREVNHIGDNVDDLFSEIVFLMNSLPSNDDFNREKEWLQQEFNKLNLSNLDYINDMSKELARLNGKDSSEDLRRIEQIKELIKEAHGKERQLKWFKLTYLESNLFVWDEPLCDYQMACPWDDGADITNTFHKLNSNQELFETSENNDGRYFSALEWPLLSRATEAELIEGLCHTYNFEEAKYIFSLLFANALSMPKDGSIDTQFSIDQLKESSLIHSGLTRFYQNLDNCIQFRLDALKNDIKEQWQQVELLSASANLLERLDINLNVKDKLNEIQELYYEKSKPITWELLGEFVVKFEKILYPNGNRKLNESPEKILEVLLKDFSENYKSILKDTQNILKEIVIEESDLNKKENKIIKFDRRVSLLLNILINIKILNNEKDNLSENIILSRKNRLVESIKDIMNNYENIEVGPQKKMLDITLKQCCDQLKTI